jgi:hypothetical protein
LYSFQATPTLANGLHNINAMKANKLPRLRGGGPVMGVEVKTTKAGDGKNYPSKVTFQSTNRDVDVPTPVNA